MADPIIQLSFVASDGEEWTRHWAFVPRVGEMVRLEVEIDVDTYKDYWWKITDIHWYTAQHEDSSKRWCAPAMASLTVELAEEDK